MHALYEGDAAIVVEVLSPSTRDVDRRAKAAAYAGLASLSMYIVVDLDARRLEVAADPPGATPGRAVHHPKELYRMWW